jgi:predicted transport protein
VEQHLDGKKAQLIDLFNTLHGCILSLGIGIQVKPFKKYIGYSNNRKFCDIVVWASKLHIYINVPLAELNDPNNIAEDCSNKGHWGTMNTRFMINSISNIDYAMSLITQAYQKQIPS